MLKALILLSLGLASAWVPTARVEARMTQARRGGTPVAQFPWSKNKAAPTKSVAGGDIKSNIAFKPLDELTEEEERALKLEVGTNFPPRTSTVKGQGYQFFQGPTPKTAVQEDLPGFFSGDNLGNMAETGLVAKGLIATMVVGTVALVGFVIAA